MLQLRKGGHRDLDRYYQLLEIDFDSEELFPKLVMHRAISGGNLELLVMYDDETNIEAAYAVVCPKSEYGYVLLKYMAVHPWYRGKGLGIELMRMLTKRYEDTNGICAEITEFDDPNPNRLRQLLKFFGRFGYEEIRTDYRIAGSPVHVMVKQIKGTADVSAVYHRMVPDYYLKILSSYGFGKMIDILPVKAPE